MPLEHPQLATALRYREMFSLKPSHGRRGGFTFDAAAVQATSSAVTLMERRRGWRMLAGRAGRPVRRQDPRRGRALAGGKAAQVLRPSCDTLQRRDDPPRQRPHPVTKVIVHSAATRPDWMAGRPTAEKVAENRRQRPAKGWRDIGYHWISDRDGTAKPIPIGLAAILGPLTGATEGQPRLHAGGRADRRASARRTGAALHRQPGEGARAGGNHRGRQERLQGGPGVWRAAEEDVRRHPCCRPRPLRRGRRDERLGQLLVSRRGWRRRCLSGLRPWSQLVRDGGSRESPWTGRPVT